MSVGGNPKGQAFKGMVVAVGPDSIVIQLKPEDARYFKPDEKYLFIALDQKHNDYKDE